MGEITIVGEIIKTISNALGSKNSLASKLAISLFLFIIIYFIYAALTTTPEGLKEVDSLTYHIPIAKTLAEGKLFSVPETATGIEYYPAISESILALFIKLGLPLGLFNVLGLSLLLYICVRLGLLYGLKENEAIVFGVSVASLNTIVRLIPAQKNDIWLAIFFLWSLYLLSKPKEKFSYFLTLGLSLGFLIGVKYSGILFAFVLLVVFWKRLLKVVNRYRLITLVGPVLVFGFFWYLRNYLIIGSPFYPVSILGFPGNPQFYYYVAFKTLLSSKGFILWTQSFISEYLIWVMAPLAIIYFLLKKERKRLFKDLCPLIIIGFLSIIVYLRLPTALIRQNIISNLRFTYPAMIPFMLTIFLLAKKLRVSEKLNAIALLNSFAILPQLAYRPKIIFVWLLTIVVIVNYFKRPLLDFSRKDLKKK